MKLMPRSALLAARAIEVVVVAVTTVDDRVAFLQQRLECRDGLIGDLSRRDHDPDAARLVEGRNQLIDAPGCGGAERLDTGACIGIGIESDHRVVTVATQTVDHVGAHLAEPDKADLHGGESFDMMAALSAPPRLLRLLR